MTSYSVLSLFNRLSLEIDIDQVKYSLPSILHTLFLANMAALLEYGVFPYPSRNQNVDVRIFLLLESVENDIWLKVKECFWNFEF